jgi:hypothetical protein
MAWEQVVKKGICGLQYGDLWQSSPAVVLSKDRIMFNKQFCETFSFRAKDIVCIFLDRTKMRLGFKHPSNDIDMDSGFVMNGDVRSKSLHANCTALIKRLPEYTRGKALVARMSQGELMIEVVLPEPPEEEEKPDGIDLSKLVDPREYPGV